jgi:8-oxo-dGTP pyrophosphatase MutT (NUDIX family)
MLVMLIPDDTPAPSQPGSDKDKDGEEEEEEERYVLLTVQPRIAAGSLAFVELPAGMVDEGGTFAGQAAREIEEELGIVIEEKELVCLSDLVEPAQPGGTEEGRDGKENELPRAMYPSAGGCDEYIPIYMHERRVPRAQLGEWTGKLTGLREHGEKITLKLVRMRDLWKEGARDAKCLAAVALWEGLRREGKI